MNRNESNRKCAGLIAKICGHISDREVLSKVITEVGKINDERIRALDVIDVITEQNADVHSTHHIDLGLFKILVYRDIRDTSTSYGGSYIVQYSILSSDFGRDLNDSDMAIALFNNFDDFYMDSAHCKHEHDCCGHYYPSKPVIFRGGPHSSMTFITQSFTQNV